MTNAFGSVAAVSADAQLGARSHQIIFAQNIGSLVSSPLPGGRVHSVHRQACNIETVDGTLLTLVTHEVGNLPHGVRCVVPEPDAFQGRLRPGQAVVVTGALLCVPAAGLSVDVSGASRWRCGLTDCAIDAESEWTLEVLLEIRAILCDLAPSGGIARQLLGDAQARDPMDSAIRIRLLTALPLLELATARLDYAQVADALGRLIGLGPGLTPSGDDFIVGFLAALHARRACEPHIGHLAWDLTGPVGLLANRTNAISRQFLLNAAAGEFSESLAKVMHAIARRHDVATQVAAAARVGHSSGTDSLMGLLFGLHPPLVLGSAARAKFASARAHQLISRVSAYWARIEEQD